MGRPSNGSDVIGIASLEKNEKLLLVLDKASKFLLLSLFLLNRLTALPASFSDCAQQSMCWSLFGAIAMGNLARR